VKTERDKPVEDPNLPGFEPALRIVREKGSGNNTLYLVVFADNQGTGVQKLRRPYFKSIECECRRRRGRGETELTKVGSRDEANYSTLDR